MLCCNQMSQSMLLLDLGGSSFNGLLNFTDGSGKPWKFIYYREQVHLGTEL